MRCLTTPHCVMENGHVGRCQVRIPDTTPVGEKASTYVDKPKPGQPLTPGDDPRVYQRGRQLWFFDIDYSRSGGSGARLGQLVTTDPVVIGCELARQAHVKGEKAPTVRVRDHTGTVQFTCWPAAHMVGNHPCDAAS